MKIVGVSHPIPPEYVERIYNKGKTVFVGKRCLCKVDKGDKFIIYQSHDVKAYTGWADIKFIGRMKPNSISEKYSKKLMLNKDEFNEYSRGKNEMFIIEFENLEKFRNPVKPEGYYVTVGGKYIYEDEFNLISSRKG